MKKNLILVLTVVAVLGFLYETYRLYTNFIAKKTGPSITLTSPNGGEMLKEYSLYTIKWNSFNIASTSKVSISIRRVPPPVLKEEGQEFDPIVFVGLENTGSKTWNVSGMYPEGNYVIGITSYDSLPITNPVSDESDEPFRIVKDEAPNWQNYVNDKFGYKLSYPNSWTFREFPDTKSGAGFSPSSSPNDIASECISVDERGTAENEYGTPFEQYVKKAAAVEIQNFEKLDSVETVATASGLTGYKTTWTYRDMVGQEKVSLPITYFDNNKVVKENDRYQKYKTVQIILNDKNCEETYNRMLFTFEKKS